MPDGRILIDAVLSDPIGTDTVFVGDVKKKRMPRIRAVGGPLPSDKA